MERGRTQKKGKVLKVAGGCVGVVIAVLAAYVIYLFASYHRIPDNQQLAVTQGDLASDVLTTGKTYSALTYNIGFGAYTPEFSFFMDGGASSWAESKDSVIQTVSGAGALAAAQDVDFALLQEIDLDGTRSYHVNEYELLRESFAGYESVFAQNYDSAFLFYPFTQPHGKNKSGIALFSRYRVQSAVRRSFPVSTSISKFFDLDRCYSIARVLVDNGKELVIFTVHMSAYGNSDEIRQGQIRMLCADMEKEYAAGNYILCGGDFNHDLKAEENAAGTYESWAYPFPRGELPEYLSFCIDQLSDEERAHLWNSSRNADMAYEPNVTYTVMLDGFLISDNITCSLYETVNTGYQYSDHEPVYLEFALTE